MIDESYNKTNLNVSVAITDFPGERSVAWRPSGGKRQRFLFGIAEHVRRILLLFVGAEMCVTDLRRAFSRGTNVTCDTRGPSSVLKGPPPPLLPPHRRFGHLFGFLYGSTVACQGAPRLRKVGRERTGVGPDLP